MDRRICVQFVNQIQQPLLASLLIQPIFQRANAYGTRCLLFASDVDFAGRIVTHQDDGKASIYAVRVAETGHPLGHGIQDFAGNDVTLQNLRHSA